MQLLLIFNLIKKIKILLLFGLVANYLLAQNIIDLNFKNIEPEAIGVKAIYRGLYSKKHNFMWLSTNEGLGIYNGYYYRKMINPNDSNDKPLSKRILTLYEDKDGFLWIGYQDSIGFTGFDYETKHFTHFKPDKSNKDVFAKEFIPSQFYQDLENRIWIATWGGGLLQYNKITKKFKCYNTETKFTNNAKIVCATVRTIFELEKNKFLICFFQERPAAYPCILNLDNNTLTEFPFEKYAKNLSKIGLSQLKRFSTIIHKTYYDVDDQKIWFGGYSCAFYVDLKNMESKRISPRTFKQEDDINLDNVSDFIKCRDGNIWASTTNSGIMIINPVTLRAKYHKQDGNCATCVGDNAIRNFTCDKNDNIWVFNVSNKISVNTPFAQEIKVKKWSELNLDYLNASHQAVPVSQMLAHSTHKIYLGSSKGLSVYDYQNDSLLRTITFGKTSYENSIQTFKFGKNNTVEFARNNTNKNYSHFAIHNLNTGKTTNEKTLQHIYSVNFLNDSVSGTYAFSKYYTDLFKYNYFKNTFDTFFVFPPEKAPEPSYGLKINDNKFLFYTDKKGFTLLDSKLNKVTTFKPNKGDKFFPDSILTSFYFNNKSSLWIGTNNGLYEFNTNTETFVDHSIYLNIKNNIIYNVFEDPSGVVWFTTSNDLFRYEPRKKQFTVFNKNIDATNFVFNIVDFKLTVASDGDYLFLPSKKGLMYFNTKSLKLPSDTPLISVFELSVNDKLRSIPINEIDLKYNENNLSIKLITNELYRSAQGTFSYSLLGLDDKIKPLKINEIELQNLPPGRYELNIFYKNSFGYFAQKLTYVINVNAPFWKRWWFLLIIAILISALILYGVKQREKNLLKKQQQLENIVSERTQELVIKTKEITLQKHVIEEKQKEIVDSIIYARRIQNALLASKTLLNKHLKNYFIYFNPKELVSGDFYWATALNNKFYFMIGDSTGHGVPGAFMSLLNINFLNEAINEKGIEKTNEILNYVRNKLILSLAEDGSQDGGKDGMDCSLLCFDFEKMVLEFSCANNPIILISSGQLTEFNADRMPVGKSPKDNIPFSCNSINLNPGDIIYALTDGFADQFGGPTGKKMKHKNLRNHLQKISHETLTEQQELLKTEFNRWKGNLEQIDDVCIVGIKV